ncbi:DUF3558 domain-containing protein [Rhodococcus zopfii]|uniref:DUF3558 domain-containing protein n=1 Tax=Rhodococcus zopfii TaxID=43772 RepID=A0ABU3WUF4_9NOCA|nr:DUF3558 family protein [Rhodococcus zopfii]MDV2477625.1 DUF3558 domain-containing protein [Rhodococcus zopfii]
MRAALNAVLLAALGAMAAGCSIDTAIPGRATKIVPATLYDPCTLPDDALHAIGVDPASTAPDFFGVQSEGWEVCAWEADWYFVTVAATDVTVEEFRARPKNTDFRSVVVGARDAYSFRSIYESEQALCDLAYPSARGTLLIRASAKGTERGREEGLPEDPCAVTLRTAITLDPYIPD